MASKRGDTDRRDALVIERRLNEALSEDHPEYDDTDELRRLIKADLDRMEGRR